MAARSAIINVITKACYKAARPLVRDFGEVEKLQVSRKGPGDFVSKADIRTDRILREELAFARPDFGFLTEEDAPVESTNFEDQRWIIDPVDGTTNFLHGIPFFVISVGLEQKGKIVAGVIYDPLRDELFHAEKGKGAYLNDQRVRVSGRQLLADCALATSHSFAGKPHHAEARALAADIGQRATVRDLGAAALHLAYVAAGRLDGFWQVGLSPWDVAAGIVIAREAGAMVSDFKGRQPRIDGGEIIAANGAVHRDLLKTFRTHGAAAR